MPGAGWHPWPACNKKRTRRSPQVQPRSTRHSLRSGLTAYSVLSPVTGLFCHRHRRDAKHHRQLSASVGAPGPHDFAVRVMPFVS
jgi:hypothetical protein